MVHWNSEFVAFLLLNLPENERDSTPKLLERLLARRECKKPAWTKHKQTSALTFTKWQNLEATEKMLYKMNHIFSLKTYELRETF